MIMDCNFIDINFSCNKFTWNQGQLWQQLDHVLFNDNWLNSFSSISFQHLNHTLSNHSPLLLTLKTRHVNSFHKFIFQNMWLQHVSFLSVVQNNWGVALYPDNIVIGMTRFWLKLKWFKQLLNVCNHNDFKNIFTHFLSVKDTVNNAELNCQVFPSNANFASLREAKDHLFKLQA